MCIIEPVVHLLTLIDKRALFFFLGWGGGGGGNHCAKSLSQQTCIFIKSVIKSWFLIICDSRGTKDTENQQDDNITVVIPLHQFGSRHPLRCYSKITFK